MIVRMIYVQVSPDQMEEARRLWKEHCAPLMIGMKGCLSEQFLACRETAGEMISMSTWENEADIEAYRSSKEHDEIQKYTRSLLSGARAKVNTYEVVP
jgi:heme-degrading monooxygenase HmoA